MGDSTVCTTTGLLLDLDAWKHKHGVKWVSSSVLAPCWAAFISIAKQNGFDPTSHDKPVFFINRVQYCPTTVNDGLTVLQYCTTQMYQRFRLLPGSRWAHATDGFQAVVVVSADKVWSLVRKVCPFFEKSFCNLTSVSFGVHHCRSSAC